MKTELQWHAGPLSDWPIGKIENNIAWMVERIENSTDANTLLKKELEEYRAERANRVINNKNKN